jgi:hypothetical protein
VEKYDWCPGAACAGGVVVEPCTTDIDELTAHERAIEEERSWRSCAQDAVAHRIATSEKEKG